MSTTILNFEVQSCFGTRLPHILNVVH